jgi:23S rRNA pseudouridine955/2504/2580 synthase
MPDFKTSPDAAGQRLDKFLRRVIPDLPLSAVYRLIRTKKIKVNGARAEESQLLKAGDLVSVRDQALQAEPKPSTAPSFPRHPKPRPAKSNFQVLHEDAHILVCVKPAGLAVHPGTGITEETLVDQVRAYLGPPPEGEFKAAPAHRLDRETSGVIVVAKTRQAIVRLAEIFTEGLAKKVYIALVMGQVQKQGVIDQPLAEHQQTGASKSQRGVNMQSALTRYKLLGQAKEAALVEVEIETGRTHQIRRHFADIDHPLVGDSKYGDFPFNRRVRSEWGAKRLFLHAARLGLPHPVSGEMMTFRANVPPDLLAVLEHLRLPLSNKFVRTTE